ncbi:MAG: hypothetical protein AAF585_27085, partial [Verrucomicrobiota bacterium]
LLQWSERWDHAASGKGTFTIFSSLEDVFERPQAEAIVKAFSLSGSCSYHLASKEDLELLEARFELKLAYRIISVMGGVLALFTALEHFVLR